MTYWIRRFKTLIRGTKHILLQHQIGKVVTSLESNSCKKYSIYRQKTKLEINASFLSLIST
jgi:hypothetical protein